MFAHCRFLTVAAAGAALATLGAAGPASAAVRYDAEAMTGFVDGGDVRDAFGWTDAQLAARASGVVFDHRFWTDDTYTVACGGTAFPLVHHRVFGRFTLGGERGRGSAGYAGGPAGFRLTGPRFGISGTSVPPAIGQPCPREAEHGSAIDSVVLVSTADGWALTAGSGALSRDLLRG